MAARSISAVTIVSASKTGPARSSHSTVARGLTERSARNPLSSIENLVRRTVKGQPLAHINTLVDIYNDLDQVRGDVLLTRAGESEPAVQLLGESDPRPPRPGEVIYQDDLGAICRRFNWKEAERTRLTESTRNALLVIEALTTSTASDAEHATATLATLIQKSCGGTVKTARIDAARREVTLLGSS